MDANTAAPDFTLPTDQGTDFHLADYRGQIVVLYFYPERRHAGLHQTSHCL